MLTVLLLATAASAAPAALHQEELPFIPEVYKNGAFFDEIHYSAALERFHAVVGQPGSESFEKHQSALRSMTVANEFILPDIDTCETKPQADVVFAQPSIAEINKPIAKYLYGGDVMPAPQDDTVDNASRKKRGAPVVTSTRWSKTTPIGYIFNSDIVESVRALIRTATAKIAANTCLSFQENGSGNQLQFHRGGGCWSYVGNAIKGKQLISIDSGCNVIGIISHEVSHALGLDHTQNRKDRDAYVTINNGAVSSAYLNNFAKLADSQNDNFGVPYDYGSDMHYGAYDFSTNGQAVIVSKDTDYDNTMGQRKYLTFNDYKMLNTLYNCSASCSKQIVCQNGGYPSPKNCNTCVCNEFYTGTNCQTPKSTITISASTPATTTYHQDYNSTLYTSGNNQNWDMFGKDAVKIIQAPAGKKIKVTINKVYAAYGGLPCYSGCPFVGLEFVDSASGDLSTMGKIFCCTKDQGYSFTSKSNVIGYKAYASPGMPFDGTVTYTVV